MARLGFTKVQKALKDSILAEMDVDIAVNEAAQVWVLHDKPFAAVPHHLEYHRGSGDLYFAAGDGSLKHYGMPVPAQSRAHLAQADTAHLFFVALQPEEKIVGHRAIPITQIDHTLEA